MRVDRGRPWSFLCCDRCTHSMYQPNCRTLHPNASNLTKVRGNTDLAGASLSPGVAGGRI